MLIKRLFNDMAADIHWWKDVSTLLGASAQDTLGYRSFIQALTPLLDGTTMIHLSEEAEHVVIDRVQIVCNAEVWQLLHEGLSHLLEAERLWSRAKVEDMSEALQDYSRRVATCLNLADAVSACRIYKTFAQDCERLFTCLPAEWGYFINMVYLPCYGPMRARLRVFAEPDDCKRAAVLKAFGKLSITTVPDSFRGRLFKDTALATSLVSCLRNEIWRKHVRILFNAFCSFAAGVPQVTDINNVVASWSPNFETASDGIKSCLQCALEVANAAIALHTNMPDLTPPIERDDGTVPNIVAELVPGEREEVVWYDVVAFTQVLTNNDVVYACRDLVIESIGALIPKIGESFEMDGVSFPSTVDVNGDGEVGHFIGLYVLPDIMTTSIAAVARWIHAGSYEDVQG